MRVLCVDDEYIAIHILESYLQELLPGKNVVIYQDGYEALEYASWNKIDLAFLDISMHPDGIEMAKRLRELNENIKIVFVTAHNTYASEAFAVHASDYILKPYDKESINNCLSKIGLLEAEIEPEVYFRTMPRFEIYIDNVKTNMRHSKMREVLAYLVFSDGCEVTTRELLDYVWGISEVNATNLSKVRTCISNLKEWLAEHGISSIFIHEWGSCCLDIRKYKVDKNLMYAGNKELLNAYDGRYFDGYSWAEDKKDIIDYFVEEHK